MRQKILLAILFPGIVQISAGRLKLGISLLVINWFFVYTLWPIIMPISLGLTLRSGMAETKQDEKLQWQKEVTEILSN